LCGYIVGGLQPAGVWEDARTTFFVPSCDKRQLKKRLLKRGMLLKRLFISRVIANPMETRAAIGIYDEAQGRYTLP
jgi:hypothetical protein